MEQLKKKYLSLINSSTLLYSLLGLILIGLGVLSFKTNIFSSADKVEVLDSVTEPEEDKQEVVVEIAGAVIKWGFINFQTDQGLMIY